MIKQFEFGFVGECERAWVRPAVMSYKPWNKGGWDAERNQRVSLVEWLMWHSPLNGGAR